jgi:hypothetical protein
LLQIRPAFPRIFQDFYGFVRNYPLYLKIERATFFSDESSGCIGLKLLYSNGFSLILSKNLSALVEDTPRPHAASLSRNFGRISAQRANGEINKKGE